MHELVIRIELAANACDGKLNLNPPYAREYCYLQFRRVCELMALGCLLLHEDIPSTQTNAAKKEWHAQKIMQLLNREHPHSFPQCVTRKMIDGIHHFDANSKPNALTYREFHALYNKCGEMLHRGTIKSIEVEAPIAQSEYEVVIGWHRKIVDLMNEHIIAQKSGNAMYLVSLKSENGLPACSLFTNWGEGTVQVASYHLSLNEAGGLVDGKSAT